jgi:HAD superfamily hydrolase (TIGR01549 family)
VQVEAVTIDAFGTLLELHDPVPALRRALAERGVDREDADVRAGFAAEVAYYVPRAHEGRDPASLAKLRRACTCVFLAAVRAGELDPDTFPFAACLEFGVLPGARDACDDLLQAGLSLAVVSNWDIGLAEVLDALGLALPVVTSAHAGAPKPDARIFELALQQINTSSDRAVHVGDSADDEEGARRAGLHFEPAPLADAARRILA